VVLEQLGEYALGDGAILQHVGHTRGNAEIVFENVEATIAVAHQICATHMSPHTMLGFHAAALHAVITGVSDQIPRDNLVLEDETVVVDVVDETVESS